MDNLKSLILVSVEAHSNDERLKKDLKLLEYMAHSHLVIIAGKLDSSLPEYESALSANKNIYKAYYLSYQLSFGRFRAN